MNTKYKKLMSDVLIFACGTFGSKLILFFLVPLYTYNMTTDEYGMAELVFTVGQLILPFVSLTIFDALLRFGLMKDVRREDALRNTSVIFFCGCAFTIAITPLLGLYRPISNWKWFLCAYVIASFASTIALIYLKVKDKNKTYAYLSAMQALILVVFNIVFLVYYRTGVRGYLLSTIIANTFTAIMAFILAGMVKDLAASSFNKSLLKSMVLYSAPLILNNVSWWLIHSSDKVMIEWMIGTVSLGLYTAASKIPSLLNVVITIFSQAWGISSIKEHESTNDAKFYSQVFRYFCIVIFGSCILVISITKPFMSMYVGSNFIEAWRYVPFLLVSACYSGLSSFAGSIYGALLKSRNVMITTIVAGGINIVLNYIFISKYGVWGAIIGTVVSYVVIAIVRLYDIHKYLKIDYGVKRLLAMSTIVSVQATFVSFDWHPWIVSAISILIFFIIVYRDLSILIKILFRRVFEKFCKN